MLRRANGTPLVAVEGTNSYGAGITRTLTMADVPVVEARPSKRASRAGRGKSDVIEAETAARSVPGRDTGMLIRPRAGKLRSALRVLLTARRSMDSQLTADRNALTALVHTIDLGIDARRPRTVTRVALVAGWRIRSSDDIERAAARRRGGPPRSQCPGSGRSAGRKHGQSGSHVQEMTPRLMDAPGIGPVTGAVFITAYSHPGRVRSEAAFAAFAGAAPIPASSGNTVRYCLSRHGDRQLNSALEIVARARLAFDPTTRAYDQRRLAGGKTSREIRRLLKRYIARQIYRQLNSALTATP